MPHQYVTDMDAEDLLHCVTVRARVARGRPTAVRAPELPPGVRFFTAADIPAVNEVDVAGTAVPLLAASRIVYYGEPIGLLVGPDIEDLLVLAGEVQIDYEPEEPVFEPDADDRDHLAAERRITVGEPEGGTTAAYQIVQGEYRTGAQEHLYNEPLAALAAWENGDLVVYTATAWPHHVYHACRAILGGRRRLLVRPTEVGEHLDGKLWQPSLVAARAALAAHLTERNVRLAYSAPEDFLHTSKRAPMFASYTAGLDAEGNLGSLVVRLVFNLGAYPLYARELVDRAAQAAVGSYRVQHVAVTVTALQSNLPPLNAFAGLGSSQARFALESHVARIAELAQVAPHEWKNRNLLKPNERGLTGAGPSQPSILKRVMENCVERSDFERKHAAYELQKKRRTGFTGLGTPSRGIGLATTSTGSGFIGRGEQTVPSRVRLRVEADGGVRLSCPEMVAAPALVVHWRRIASETLGVELKQVTCTPEETRHTPDAGPAFLSRYVTLITAAVETCCAAASKKRARTEPPFEISRSFRLSRSQRWDEERFRGQPFVAQAHGAAVVEVDVDPMTLDVRVRGVWMSLFAGRLIDPRAALQTAERGALQALGWATGEQVTFRDGAVRRGDYERYAPDIRTQNPFLSVTFVHADPKSSPRGVGEVPFACVPAAYAAAVSQATGHYVDRLPVTPRLLDSYLEEE
ncbi:MAG: xanthine dehydrogenase family protein molybdopterin-binding subunit [Spirochaetaceae bacterium]